MGQHRYANVRNPMTQLLEGKTGLIMGVANKRSIAWGITNAVHKSGARLVLTYQNERLGRVVEQSAIGTLRRRQRRADRVADAANQGGSRTSRFCGTRSSFRTARGPGRHVRKYQARRFPCGS